jgi:phage gp29-like protein
MQLYDQFNRPIRAEKAPSRRTIAAAPLTDAWREYVAAGLTPERLASIFREADAGDVARQAQLFEQMEEKDGHILGERGKRVNVILDVAFTVKPASEDARDVKVAEFVTDYIGNCTDYPDVLTSLQDAVGKGYSGLEINWDVSAGQALPDAFEFVEQKRFLFTDAAGVLCKTPRLITDEHTMGEEIPAWKMLFHRYGGKSGHPARSGIYRVCAWMFLFKNYSLKDWVIFCEVYGMPLRLGKYDSGASGDDKDALIAAISSLGSDAAGIISKSTEIEFVENAKGKATGDLYQALADFANKENSKAILGQTLSAEVGDKGSYAAAKTHNEVRLDLVKADSRALAATIRHQLIRPIVGFNFGWDTPVPKYEAPWEEAEDLVKKSTWVCELLDRHVEMPLSWLRTEFAIPEPDKDETVVGRAIEAPAVPTTAKVTAKATATQPDSGDDPAAIYARRLDAEAAPAINGLIDPVRQLVAAAGSLEEIRDGLIGLYPEMDPEAFGTLMQRAMAAAELAGRYEVKNEK